VAARTHLADRRLAWPGGTSARLAASRTSRSLRAIAALRADAGTSHGAGCGPSQDASINARTSTSGAESSSGVRLRAGRRGVARAAKRDPVMAGVRETQRRTTGLELADGRAQDGPRPSRPAANPGPGPPRHRRDRTARRGSPPKGVAQAPVHPMDGLGGQRRVARALRKLSILSGSML